MAMGGDEGVQAISAYVDGAQGVDTFAETAARGRRNNSQRVSTGMDVIPTFTLGWDPRPRVPPGGRLLAARSGCGLRRIDSISPPLFGRIPPVDIIDGKNVNLEVAGRDFKYYIFDWDDNILHMPTRIYLEHLGADGVWRPTSVSTSTFALVRTDEAHYRMPRAGGREAAFRDFQDAPDAATADLAFIRDTRAALDRIRAGEPTGPSFDTFRKTLREGRIFAIVTARGHAPDTIREAVRIFIDEVLTPAEREEMLANLRGYRACFDKVQAFGTDEQEISYFLSMCRYHAVTNPGFKEMLAKDEDFGARFAGASSEQRPELAKEFAIRDFVEHLYRTMKRTGGVCGRQVSVGFSDDDAGNVKAVSDYLRDELARHYGSCKFVVYDTSDPEMSNGQKITLSGQMELDLGI